MMNIAIIGCGYVGCALAQYWQQNSSFVVTATTTLLRMSVYVVSRQQCFYPALLALKPHITVMEATGVNYSRLWGTILSPCRCRGQAYGIQRMAIAYIKKKPPSSG